MTGTHGDDVLNLSASSDSDFSGFDDEDFVETPRVAQTVEVTSEKVEKRGKSPVKGKKVVKKSNSKSKNVQKSSKSVTDREKPSASTSSKSKSKKQVVNPSLDINSLSRADLLTLKQKLGLIECEPEPEEDYDLVPLAQRPNIHVEIDRDDISDSEEHGSVVAQRIENELFGESEEEWSTPKTKAMDRDKPISPSLARLINLACSTPCDTEGIVSKYKLPENLDKASPPLVNQEVWRIVDKRGHSQDKGLQDVQALLTAALIPVIKLAETVKGSDAKAQCKSYISDALTLMGQVQYNISVKRRYSLRPHINRKYSSLCSVSMPITSKLFGDDVAKDMKLCDSMYNIGTARPWWKSRGSRQSHRPARGGSYYGNSGYGRYQPYQSSYQQRGGRPFRRGFSGGYRGKSSSSSTHTAPSDK